MKTKKAILVGVILPLIASFILLAGCTQEVETYSKYGFSFEYPKKHSINEIGMLQNEATEESGLVQATLGNEELLQVTWVGMQQSIWEVAVDLQVSLEDSFAGLEEESIETIQRGELLGAINIPHIPHPTLYQDYVAIETEGNKIYGVVAVFYCDESQKLFKLMTVNYTSGAKQDVLGQFLHFLNSFICH